MKRGCLMDYQEFLNTKRVEAKVGGFTVEKDRIHPMLFDFQKDIVIWTVRTGRAACFADCGLGKTFIQLEWARIISEDTGGDVLIIAPLAVSLQTKREGEKIGITVHICRKQVDVKPGINITNYEMAEHFQADKFSGVVLDECFTPDTPIAVFNIDKSLGTMYIKDIRKGDLIYNVNGVDNVQNIYKRQIHRAVQICYGGRRVTCSENHPFFTLYGWKCAQDLQPGDYLMATAEAVRLVRDNIQPEVCCYENGAVLREILFSEMEDEYPGTQGEGTYKGSTRADWEENQYMVQERESIGNKGARQNNGIESNEQSGNQGESIIEVAGDEIQTFRAWGKWDRTDITRADNEGCTIRELDSGICYITGATETGFSDMLQSRLRESRPENSNRVRRSQSQVTERTGQKERTRPGFFRVDSVEILEQGHPKLEKYRDGEGHIYFYDIKATRHPSFSVNGALVHNSSALKNYSGATKKLLTAMFAGMQYKLCCTATPSPNDHMEILNHASYLDVMQSHEALAIWFINDSMNMGTYRLKNHAVKDFWKWVSSWAVSLSKPSDLGYEDNGFNLPPLNVVKHLIDIDIVDGRGDGELFRNPDLNATGYHREKRYTSKERAIKTAEIVNSTDELYCIWCDTNYDGDELKKTIPEAVEVRGNHSIDYKERVSRDFSEGKIRVLISKPSIFGFGLNFQICHNVIFCGLSYSYESYYQATRRFWRFGQKKQVNVDIIIGESEKAILDVILTKEEKYHELKSNMQIAANAAQYSHKKGTEYKMGYIQKAEYGDEFTIINGDSIEEVKSIETGSVHFQIFSPPFSCLYIYSDSYRDMGNCKGDGEFFEHFDFLIPELFRILTPGRLCAVHCKQLVNYKGRDGASGLRDFRGDIIRAFIKHGFIYHSEVCIWKDPVIEMQRTKSHGLLYKQLRKDSSYSRQGLADYLVIFRKWADDGIDSAPVNYKTKDNFELDKWQNYASPVWFDIRQTNVLNIQLARDGQDEKHICLARDSLVLTKEGYIPIQDIKIGDLVLTHKGRWMPVTAKAMTGSNPVLKVKAQGVPELFLTPSHKVWARSSNGKKHPKQQAVKSTPRWVESKNLIGEYVNLKLPDTEEPENKSELHWWIVGRWLADGHIDKRGVAHISCGESKLDYFLSKVGAIAGNPRKGTAYQVPLKDKGRLIRTILDKCGKHAHEKHIPPESFTLPVNYARALLDGYLSGDGHYREDRERWYATSVSKELLLGMQVIVQRVTNQIPSIHQGRKAGTAVIEGRTVKTHQEWVMSWGGTSHSFSFIADDGAWKKVKSISIAGIAETWSIQVMEDESYTAEGCIVKNCPLQLDVIERAVELWTNPGDVVFSPFAGIGSEGVVSLKMGRRFIGIELKESYWKQAANNLRAVSGHRQYNMFDISETLGDEVMDIEGNEEEA